MIAEKLATMPEGRPKKTVENSTVSTSSAAMLLNVSRDSVQQARKVRTDGNESLIFAQPFWAKNSQDRFGRLGWCHIPPSLRGLIWTKKRTFQRAGKCLNSIAFQKGAADTKTCRRCGANIGTTKRPWQGQTCPTKANPLVQSLHQ